MRERFLYEFSKMRIINLVLRPQVGARSNFFLMVFILPSSGDCRRGFCGLPRLLGGGKWATVFVGLFFVNASFGFKKIEDCLAIDWQEHGDGEIEFLSRSERIFREKVCPIFREGLCSCEKALLTKRYEAASYKLHRPVKALSAAGGQMIV